ncbi:hypothetical protein HY546_01635, partial [archaeon]|nr:hypothetical protein [archaeon]
MPAARVSVNVSVEYNFLLHVSAECNFLLRFLILFAAIVSVTASTPAGFASEEQVKYGYNYYPAISSQHYEYYSSNPSSVTELDAKGNRIVAKLLPTYSWSN